MGIHNLKYLFKPESIAVIGASSKPNSVGHSVMRNLLKAGFTGPIMPINPKAVSVSGVLAYNDIESLPIVPEMAVIVTPPKTIPGIIKILGEKGTKAAIVLTAGLASNKGESGETLQDEMLEYANKYSMRILGPNCLGLLNPSIGLNASFTYNHAQPGNIAFVSQSGALLAAVLDWANPKGIGFSYCMSIGDAADTNFGDILDFLSEDPDTSAIMIYMESIKNPRSFMSAARAAARKKPVLAIKSGRNEEGAAAASSHTGAIAGGDAAYDAAFRRSGVLRVDYFEELFATVETLAHYKQPPEGNRLAILTNGGGLGVMAVDDLMDHGGILAELSDETKAKLDEVLPPTWSHANPVDIIGDARGDRYANAFKILAEAPEIDAIFTMYVPTALTSADEVADGMIEIEKELKTDKLSTAWIGDEAVAAARKRFTDCGIPSFDTPEKGCRSFMNMVEYQERQRLLTEIPESDSTAFEYNTEAAKGIIKGILAEGRSTLTEPEAKEVFAHYGIPVVQTKVATSPDEAMEIASCMKFPVAVKILSTDITHKSDVGGVVLNLETPEEVKKASQGIIDRVSKTFPNANIEGFTVQEMAQMSGVHELIVGVTTDPIFGPIMMFGHGGTSVEVVKDSVTLLPPLNDVLAKDAIKRTRVYNLLKGYRDRPAADIEGICLTLLKISQLVIDIPEIAELDINPLFANDEGVLAVDARIMVKEISEDEIKNRLAICPYPKDLEEHVTIANGEELFIRPIKPKDEPTQQELMGNLADEKDEAKSIFFGSGRSLPHNEMAKLTQIDYDREMAFVVLKNKTETVGVVRNMIGIDGRHSDFNVVIRKDYEGKGIATKLLEKIIKYNCEKEINCIYGRLFKGNSRAVDFLKKHGFEEAGTEGDHIQVLKLNL